MKTSRQSEILNFEESLLEAETRKAFQAGYPKEVVSKAKKFVLRRLKDESRPPVKNLSSFFRHLLIKFLWKEKETPKNREELRRIKNKLLLQSLKKQMAEAGLSEQEIAEKIEKELGLDFYLINSN